MCTRPSFTAPMLTKAPNCSTLTCAFVCDVQGGSSLRLSNSHSLYKCECTNIHSCDDGKSHTPHGPPAPGRASELTGAGAAMWLLALLLQTPSRSCSWRLLLA